MPTLREHLRKELFEPTPEWLANYAPGVFSLDAFFASRVVYCPEASLEVQPVEAFAAGHAAHCFVCADDSIPRSAIEQRLMPAIGFSDTPLLFDGYEPLHRIEVADALRLPSRPLVAGSRPYAFVEVLEREPHLDDQHGPKRLAVLFIAANYFRAFQLLFCPREQSPFCIVLRDQGQNAMISQELEFSARTRGMAPLLLAVPSMADWDGYARVPHVQGEAAQVRQQLRFLYRRTA